LVGNKCDLVSKKAVSYEVAKAFADKLDIPFLETSAKAATNVEKAFLTMADEIKNNITTNTVTAPGIKKPLPLDGDSVSVGGSGCC